MVQENPFSGVQVARISKKERNGKTENMSYREVQKVLKAIDKVGDVQFGNYVRFLLSTGCRRNDILQVKWENIDRENWTITVYAEKPKRWITFPINKALRRVIERMEVKESGYVFVSMSRRRGKLKGKVPWYEDTVSKWFKKYIRKTGLPEHFHLHSLRHTYATYLLSKGVSLEIVQKLLGHASPLTTADNYDHTIALHFREQADLVDFEPVKRNPRRKENGHKKGSD